VTERGLAATTARGYADMVRLFLVQREKGSGLGLEDLTAAEVTAFVLATCPGKPKGSAKLTVTALRSLLGFLHVEGLIGEPLGQVVPAVASWRLAGLPKALEPGQVAALLAEIWQVLRHRRLLSTAIYAKADVQALRALARCWPGGAR
jgi:integrase/recombinase XerD